MNKEFLKCLSAKIATKLKTKLQSLLSKFKKANFVKFVFKFELAPSKNTVVKYIINNYGNLEF